MSKRTVWLADHEIYPVYSIDESSVHGARQVELDEDLVERLTAVNAQWDAIQREVSHAIDQLQRAHPREQSA